MTQAMHGSHDDAADDVGDHGRDFGAGADPLLGCLMAAARHFDKPSSRTAILAGLPRQETMDPDLFVRAADRLGIEAIYAQEPLRRHLPLNLPLVVFRASAGPVVVHAVDREGYLEVHDPALGRDMRMTTAALAEDYGGAVIRLTPRGVAKDLGLDESAFLRDHWLFGVAKRYWRSYAKVIVASATINLLALASSLFILNVYDRILPNQAFASLWVLAIGVMLAFVFDLVLRLARSVILDHVSRRVDQQVSSAIFERVLNAGLQHRPATTGAFANRAAEYEFVRDFFTSSTLTLAIDMAFTVVFLLVIYALAGWIVVVPLIGVALVLAIGLVVQALIGRRMAAAQEYSAMRHSLLVESIASIETVKSLRGEGYLLRKWDQLVRSGADIQEHIRQLSSFASSAAMFVQQMIGVWIVIAGVFRFAEGDMSMGAIIATVILAGRATAPLGQLASMLARFRQAMQSLQTLDQIMALPDERDTVSHRVNRTVTGGDIEFRNVEFVYPGSQKKTLSGVSFRIRPGERVGVIGRIGSGKTTIGRLMSGLYHATGGEVLIDGVDIRQYHPHEVRSAIALVVQDSDLFYGSVKTNLLLANPQAQDQDLVRAAQLSGLDQIVAGHPLGFEMPVGEKGTVISGGQRQIVALARSLVSPFKALFLDEPTSAMDAMTERALIQRLKHAVPPGRTFILSTHRHSALALVDRIIVIEGGRVAADGPKDQVLKALADAARAGAGGPAGAALPQGETI